MKISIPKEIKNNEYKVGITPVGVREITAQAHPVFIEQHAGAGIGKNDEEYRQAGTEILSSAEAVFAESDMIIKVKELQAQERELLRSSQILFTYLNHASDPKPVELIMRSGAITYETVIDKMGRACPCSLP